jgi:ABC-type lipopolysaccharide export system ATPase subunit
VNQSDKGYWKQATPEEVMDALRRENDALRSQREELVAALEEVLRDQLKMVNLHQMAPGPRKRIEVARSLLAKLKEAGS